jgi:hypothetical protein
MKTRLSGFQNSEAFFFESPGSHQQKWQSATTSKTRVEASGITSGSAAKASCTNFLKSSNADCQ